MKQLVNLKKACAIALSVVLFGSCMKNEEPAPAVPGSRISVINAYSPLSGTQLRFVDQTLGTLRYSENSGALFNTNLNDLTLTVLNQTTNQILIDKAPIRTAVDKYYSAYIYGKAIPAKFLLLNDTPDQSTETKTRIRFLNLGEGVEAVDLFIGGQKVETLSNRVPETQANAVTSERFILSPRDAGAADIIVKTLDGQELAKLASYDFRSNSYISIVLLGDKASTGESAEEKAKALKIGVFFSGQ
ncbi:DUF4397 domain-containing protein [Sphingobacterium sp. lm-10]|uniref:DUF4397 domain-containing protein n=1 Tax=Sphingobacterium sp. lm-10 TaxID=2944904 RepID=UPI002020FA39|nr:DUF4397 domain-containing protein [Sphingobacterium sp. lm-10]MCL7986589.1 DUF4397 domain-containing protein [Sphingobacterium sp. lm-10]